MKQVYPENRQENSMSRESKGYRYQKHLEESDTDETYISVSGWNSLIGGLTADNLWRFQENPSGHQYVLTVGPIVSDCLVSFDCHCLG